MFVSVWARFVKTVLIAGTGYLEVLRIIDDINKADDCEKLKVIGFLDDNVENRSRNLYGHQILGGFKDIKRFEGSYTINTIARNTRLRRRTTDLLTGYGAIFINIVHPGVCLSGVTLGTGNIIGRGTVIEPGTKVGDHNVILHNTVVAHDSEIGSYCFIGNNCSLQGANSIEDEVYVGSGTTSVPNIVFGSRSQIGINCAVVLDVASDSVLISSPARRLR